MSPVITSEVCVSTDEVARADLSGALLNSWQVETCPAMRAIGVLADSLPCQSPRKRHAAAGGDADKLKGMA
jgi:hypothetical protein